jgi:hypothetical protein
MKCRACRFDDVETRARKAGQLKQLEGLATTQREMYKRADAALGDVDDPTPEWIELGVMGGCELWACPECGTVKV